MLNMKSLHDITINDVITGETLKLFRLRKRSKNDHRVASNVELFHWLSKHRECEPTTGGFYDRAALEIRQNPRNSDKGVGGSEIPIRSMLGISLEAYGSSATMDIQEPGFEGEVKDVVVQNKRGKLLLIDIKLNKNGRQAWDSCRAELQSHPSFACLSENQRRLIDVGELAYGSILGLRDDLKKIIKERLLPSRTMVHEPRIYCGGTLCFLVIPQHDYDTAWIKPRVTMGGSVKYTLSRRYIQREILTLLKEPKFVQKMHQPLVTVTSIKQYAASLEINETLRLRSMLSGGHVIF